MEKRISDIRSQDGFFEPIYVPIFSRAFEKFAGESYVPTKIAEYVKTLKPRSDGRYLHVIALGASDLWSCNRKGDAFQKWALLGEKPPEDIAKLYKDAGIKIPEEYGISTFEKHAYTFRNHDNSHPSKTIGERIKCAAYNDKMDRVELIIFVKTALAPDLVEMIDNGEDISTSMGTRVPGDRCILPGTLIETTMGLLPIETIVEGDSVKTHKGHFRKVTQTHKNIVNSRVIKLVWIGNNSGVSVTENHPVLIIPKEQIYFNYGRRKPVQDLQNKCNVVWRDAGDIRIGDHVVYPIAPQPSIQDTELAPKIMLAHVCGYYVGDGSRIQQRRLRSRKGPYKLQGLSFSCNEAETSHIDRLITVCNAAGIGRVSKRYDTGRHAVSVDWRCQPIANLVIELCGINCQGKQVPHTILHGSSEEKLAFMGSLIDCDGAVDDKNIRITTSNKRVAYEVKAMLNSMGINCGLTKQPSTDSGFKHNYTMYHISTSMSKNALFLPYSEKVKLRVEKSNFNMKQYSQQIKIAVGDIEYIAAPITCIEEVDYTDIVYNLTVDEDESYIADNIVTHNCSVCGNIAKTVMNYCDHAKELGKVASDGQKHMVFNDFCDFFDHSIVRVPADRSALSIRKVASLSYYRPEFTINIPYAIAKQAKFQKENEIEKEVPAVATSVDKSLDEKEEAVDKLRKEYKPRVEQDEKESPDFSEKFLGKLKGKFGKENALRGLTRFGIVLKPREAKHMVGDHMPNISSLAGVPSELDNILKGIASKRSMFGPAIIKRTVQIMIVPGSKHEDNSKKEDTDIKEASMIDAVKDYYKWLSQLDVNDLNTAAHSYSVMDAIQPDLFKFKFATLYMEKESSFDWDYFMPFLLTINRYNRS